MKNDSYDYDLGFGSALVFYGSGSSFQNEYGTGSSIQNEYGSGFKVIFLTE